MLSYPKDLCATNCGVIYGMAKILEVELEFTRQ